MFLPTATLIYIKWKKLYIDTWNGWSRDLFLDWLSFMKLAMSGVIMLCIEWWSFEVYTIAAGMQYESYSYDIYNFYRFSSFYACTYYVIGLLGTVVLGAQGALVNTLLFFFVVSSDIYLIQLKFC